MNQIDLTIPLADLLDRYEEDYLKFQGRELRVSTNRLDHLRKELGSNLVLTPMRIEQFIMRWRDKKPATRNRYRSLLSHLLGWAIERGLANGVIPVGVLKAEAENNQRDRRLSPAEEAELVKHMSQELKDLFYAALDTGLRKGALLRLKFEDVHDGAIHVPGRIQKHRKSQRIPLTQRLAEIIERLRSDRGFESGSRLIFTVSRFHQQWDNARRDAKIKGLTWHDLRGEFASRLDEKGVSVVVTSKLLGHASLNTTQRYLRPRTEQFDEAISKLGV